MSTEKQREYWKEYHRTHMEQARAKYKRYRLSHLEQERERSINNYYKDIQLSREKGRNRYRENKEYMIKQHKESIKKMRLKLMNILGGVNCVRCNAAVDYDNLEFDHINGGGKKDIERFKSVDTSYRYYVKHQTQAKQTLQVLCEDCHKLKTRENKEIPGRPKGSKNIIDRTKVLSRTIYESYQYFSKKGLSQNKIWKLMGLPNRSYLRYHIEKHQRYLGNK